jgi:hypothetical protein
MSFSSGERYIQSPTVSSKSHCARLTTEWLFDVGPFLTAAAHGRIVRIDTSAGIGTSVDITRAVHNFGEALHSASLTCRFSAHNIFDRIAGWTRDNSSPAVCLNGGDKDSQF